VKRYQGRRPTWEYGSGVPKKSNSLVVVISQIRGKKHGEIGEEREWARQGKGQASKQGCTLNNKVIALARKKLDLTFA